MVSSISYKFRLYPNAEQRRQFAVDFGVARWAWNKMGIRDSNTTALKDAIAGGLGRQEAGPGYTHFPDWLGDWFFDEMAAEVRTAKGWENPAKRRNEALDLMAYNLAAFLKLSLIHI